MRDLIKNQLKQVVYADLSHYDETTGVFTIPKYAKPKYDVGKMYIVQIPNELVGNTHSVLATNWNNNTAPQSAYLKIYVSKFVGKMIYVDSVAFNMQTRSETSFIWSGYLPTEQITQLEAI